MPRQRGLMFFFFQPFFFVFSPTYPPGLRPCHFYSLLVHCNRLLGGDLFVLFPTLYVLLPIHVFSRFFWGGCARNKRLNFTRNSIGYLFRTTYTPADSLTIAALVAYMNPALPPDQHHEFDTAEATRAAKMLPDRGSVAFQR